MLIAAALLLLQSMPAAADGAVATAPVASAPVPYAAAATDLYRVEAMPFSPPANFAPPVPQGDTAGAELRQRLDTAVTVDAYRRSYERAPSVLAQAYDQGVAQAEISADSRMGALDGRWRVLDGEGAELMRLALRDAGDRPIEGAWRKAGHLGPILSASRSGARATVALPDGELMLDRTPDGWRGVIRTPDGERPVTLSR